MRGYWGWRPLVFGLFLSVLIVGCLPGHTLSPTATPTLTQLAPLITRPAMTLTPSSTPGLPLVTTTPLPEMTASAESERLSPTCFTVNIDEMLCLGEIGNASESTLKNVILRTTFYDAEGRAITSRQTALLQHSLPPRRLAPYHVLLTEAVNLHGLTSLNTEIIAGEASPTGRPPDILIEAQGGEWRDGFYVIALTLQNGSRRDLRDVQIIASVYDAVGRLVGYRILDVPVLLGGEGYGGEILITPVVEDADLTYTLEVIAR